MREQHDPVRLIIQLSAIALLLANVVLSVGALREIAVASERSFIATEQAPRDDYAGCRTITSEQQPLDEVCRRVWADNRRRFFGLDHEVGKASIISAPTTASQPSSDNSRADSNRPTGSPDQKE